MKQTAVLTFWKEYTEKSKETDLSSSVYKMM